MRKVTPMRWPRPLRVLGSFVALGAVLGVDLAASAAGPPPRYWPPGLPIPPRGPFLGPPALPGPFPMPFVPARPELEATGPTDRCLLYAPSVDPRSIVATPAIDPGIFAKSRVQGLPIRPASVTRWSRP